MQQSKGEDMRYEDVLECLESWADPVAVTGMARFGIASKNTYGVSVQNLRGMAKKIGRDHLLAQKFGPQEFMKVEYWQV